MSVYIKKTHICLLSFEVLIDFSNSIERCYKFIIINRHSDDNDDGVNNNNNNNNNLTK